MRLTMRAQKAVEKYVKYFRKIRFCARGILLIQLGMVNLVRIVTAIKCVELN